MSFLPRNLRSPELHWLLVALIISVASLSSVAYLADRMQRAFDRDAKQLIAADYLIQSDQPLPIIFQEQALSNGLRIAQTVVFPTMANFEEQSSFVSLKAVSSNYPLRGVIKVGNPVPYEPDVAQSDIPAPQTVWVDPALLPALNIRLGDNISLGQSTFKVTAVITQELDKGAGFLNFAPRVMMRHDELVKTGLIGFGSRVTYKLLLAGRDDQLVAYIRWAQEKIQTLPLRGVRLEGVDNSQPFMRNTLERAEKFLSLVALLTAMVASVAMALTARRYVHRQSNVVAIWKCLGASRRKVLGIYAREILWVGLLGAVIGSLLGWFGHQALLLFLGDLLLANLPAPSIWPMAWSIFVSLVLLLSFVYPPIISLSNVSPLRVLRRDIPLPSLSTWLLAGIGLCGFFALLMVVTRDLILAAVTLGGFLLAAILFLLVSWLVVRVAAWLSTSIPGQGVVHRFAWQSLSRRALLTSVQISSLAIAMMALLLLMVIRQDLLAVWQAGAAADSPNRFLINIQPDQKNEVSTELHRSGVSGVTLYPMVRGRLTHVNQHVVMPQHYADERAQRLVDREFNLSYGSMLPEKNKVIAGRWHGNTHAPEISIEQGIAKNLGLRLGDELQFDVAGSAVSAKITSIRKLDWGSLRVNFFAILPETILSSSPQTWITAYQQLSSKDPDHVPVDMALVKRFPNITVVNVESSLRQIQGVLDKLSSAIELLFVFTISAGLLVLSAALAASQNERLRDAALLKVMGARRHQIQRALILELGVIGFIAGFVAAIGALIIAWALASFVFEIHLGFSWSVMVGGVVGGVLICILGGLGMQRKIAHIPASAMLRELS
jgi:putative ABC transport system permease protein